MITMRHEIVPWELVRGTYQPPGSPVAWLDLSTLPQQADARDRGHCYALYPEASPAPGPASGRIVLGTGLPSQITLSASLRNATRNTGLDCRVGETLQEAVARTVLTRWSPADGRNPCELARKRSGRLQIGPWDYAVGVTWSATEHKARVGERLSKDWDQLVARDPVVAAKWRETVLAGKQFRREELHDLLKGSRDVPRRKPTTEFSDDFSTGTLANFTKVSGTANASVVSGRVRFPSTAIQLVYVWAGGPLSGADHYAQATLDGSKQADGRTRQVRVLIRGNGTAETGYAVEARYDDFSGSTTEVRMLKLAAGAATLLQSGGIKTDNRVGLVDADGSTITASWDGVGFASQVDATYTGLYVGFSGSSDGANYNYLDDWYATDGLSVPSSSGDDTLNSGVMRLGHSSFKM